MGTPHVRGRHQCLCGHVLLTLELLRGRAIGDQGVQLDVLSAIRSRLSRDAAAVRCLPAGVSVSACALYRRRNDSWRRVSDAVDLFHLVVALRTPGAPESVAGNGAGVANLVAAAQT